MPNFRLGKCEVCDKTDAKYCCPECELKTCSLPCVVIHKKELNCKGIRNRVKYKKIKSFTNMDLQNDYRLLEEIGRSVEKYSKDKRIHYNKIYDQLPTHLLRLRAAASRRNTVLQFLPKNFDRHKNNTTFLDYKTQELLWRIEWIFPQADCAKYIDKRVVDTELLGNILDNYINPLHNNDKQLQYYHAAGHSGITLLLIAEKVPGQRFYELDLRSSFRENFVNKVIVEFPTIYVLLKDHKQCYDIITPEEEEETIERIENEQLNRCKDENSFKRNFNKRPFYRNDGFRKNLLFSAEAECNDNSDEPYSHKNLRLENTESSFNINETNFNNKNNYVSSNNNTFSMS
ncbi:box C/D snoRNA protein 1 [Lycorma delicatula]|uniref:box C/D snoRNA protein 1 n=1 Tax=Lycorma delicatula TaxID=130591 RepID=UPI003F5139C1